MPHAQYAYRRLLPDDPGAYLAGCLAALLYDGLAHPDVAVTWPPPPVDEWLRRIEAGERLHLLARRGPRYDVILARSAGWYVLAEGDEQRCEATPTHLAARLAAVDPASDPEARFQAYALGLRDPLVEPGLALRFTNDDASYPWSLTLRRLASGRFATLEEWADLHDAMGGHLSGETRDELDEEAARRKVGTLLSRYFPWVVAA